MDLFEGSERPYVIAHRGASDTRPENTAGAFDKALAEQSEGIELDVQLSKDQVPVLYHDKTLAKLGGGTKRIADKTVEELQALDAGGWFAKRYRNERILVLQDVLRRYGPITNLLVEIKVAAQDKKGDRNLALARKVVDVVKQEDMGKRVFILSFDFDTLMAARAENSALRYVLNLKTIPRSIDEVNGQLTKLFALSVHIKALTKSLVEHCHSIGKPVMTYTVNSREEADHALTCGVDVVMSDKPGWLQNFLRERGLRG